MDSIYILLDASELAGQFQIDRVLLYTGKSREIRPTGSCPAIVSYGGERCLDEFRWGLIPFWAPDSVWVDRDLFQDKRSFVRMVRRQRCVVPCSGFFIKRQEAGRSKLFRVREGTGRTFGIAGLYDLWHSKSTGEEVRTCTLLAVPSGPLLSLYSDREPAVIEGDEIEAWLSHDVRDLHPVVSRIGCLTKGRFEVSAVSSTRSMLDAVQPEEELIQTPAEFA